MSTTDLYADLIRRAEACDGLATDYANTEPTGDDIVAWAENNRARVEGKAAAYRHAAELLRGAVAAAVEEERATCAMIAGREGVAWAEAARIDGVDYWAPRRASSDIADAIRARGESPRGDAASDGREGAE
jgi:hypothetical protein